VPGSVNIGLNGDFAVWAATLFPIDQRILLVCEPGTEREASVRLARVGFHNILGHLEGGLRAWQYANLPTERIDSLDGLDVAYFQQTGEVVLVDVRKDSEVRRSGLKRSFHIPLSDLPHRLIDFDPLKTYLLCCVGGYRSMIAASLLRRSGIIHVMDVRGGVNQLQEEYPEALASNF
jgi:rhodanese-related sulfurtransferase